MTVVSYNWIPARFPISKVGHHGHSPMLLKWSVFRFVEKGLQCFPEFFWGPNFRKSLNPTPEHGKHAVYIFMAVAWGKERKPSSLYLPQGHSCSEMSCQTLVLDLLWGVVCLKVYNTLSKIQPEVRQLHQLRQAVTENVAGSGRIACQHMWGQNGNHHESMQYQSCQWHLGAMKFGELLRGHHTWPRPRILAGIHTVQDATQFPSAQLA